MKNKILIFDDVIDLEYQNIIKEILLGDRQYKGYDFPWYLTHDVTKQAKADSQLRPAFFMDMLIIPVNFQVYFMMFLLDLFKILVQKLIGRM